MSKYVDVEEVIKIIDKNSYVEEGYLKTVVNVDVFKYLINNLPTLDLQAKIDKIDSIISDMQKLQSQSVNKDQRAWTMHGIEKAKQILLEEQK